MWAEETFDTPLDSSKRMCYSTIIFNPLRRHLKMINTQTKLEDLQDKLEALLDTEVPSTRSEDVAYIFDVSLHEISVSAEHWDKGTLKSYSVSFDAEGAIDSDVEWETEDDGGYMAFKRLPKGVRAVCKELALLTVRIEALEEVEEAEEEAEEEGLTTSKDCDKASISEQEGSQVIKETLKMTIAKKLYNEYYILPRDERGFYGEGWYALIKRARNEAIREEEESPESYDPTIILTFEDGSTLRVDNPRQACYSGVAHLD